MAEPTLTQVFGEGAQRIASGATVAEGGLFIPDSALIAAGLTNPESKSAESHLAAIFVSSKNYLTETNYGTNLDQSIYITNGIVGKSFTNRGENNDSYTVDPYTINFTKLDTSSTLNPGDY